MHAAAQLDARSGVLLAENELACQIEELREDGKGYNAPQRFDTSMLAGFLPKIRTKKFASCTKFANTNRPILGITWQTAEVNTSAL